MQPSGVRVAGDGERVVLEWNTALAGRQPVRACEIRAGERLLLLLPFRPQLTEAPLSVSLPAAAAGDGAVTVTAAI